MMDTNPGVFVTVVAEPIDTVRRPKLDDAEGSGTNVSAVQILLEPRRSVRAASRAVLSTHGPRTAGMALPSTWDACLPPQHLEAGVRFQGVDPRLFMKLSG